MSKLNNPPLIEAIFELRWGEAAPGELTYTQEERALFAGKVSASAASQGFARVETLDQGGAPISLPMTVSHRFRKAENEWPCYQVGLGIFTANQVADGYSWLSFKEAIGAGVKICNQAEAGQLGSVKDTLKVTLRYQDAFFLGTKVTVKDYLNEHFNIEAGLPESFMENENLDAEKSSVNIQFNTQINVPKGNISIKIANAVIGGRLGLLLETVVTSSAKDAIDGELSEEALLDWAEKAHMLQKHSFSTLVEKSAYS
jgi:uncharacterized protein (TIGR04255 family)